MFDVDAAPQGCRRMCLYYFHFRTAQGDVLVDPIGSDHEDDDAAVLEAVLSGSELGRGPFSRIQGGTYVIRTEDGRLVEMVPVWRN